MPYRKEIDHESLIEMLAGGVPVRVVAEEFKVSNTTIYDRINVLRRNESALLAYDKTHYLDLIDVKQRLIAGVTDEKIAEAPLQHIANAYGTFNKAELLLQGRPTEIHGLMGYLMHLEKEDIEEAQSQNSPCAEQLNLFDVVDI